MRDIQTAKVQLFQTFLEVSLPSGICLVDHTENAHFKRSLRPELQAAKPEQRNESHWVGARRDAPGKSCCAVRVWGTLMRFEYLKLHLLP